MELELVYQFYAVLTALKKTLLTTQHYVPG